MQFAHLAHGELTHVGARRKSNEDAILSLPAHGVYCVADGMGGVEGGEVASKAVVTYLDQAFAQLAPSDPAVGSLVAKGHLIDRALNDASAWIKQRSDKRGISGSGSTAVVLAFDGAASRHALVLHAGDSRVYRYRTGALAQVSADHTVAAAAGITDAAELPPMFRGVVTRAVGVRSRVEVEKTVVDVQTGDIFLLASDGLDKMVSDAEIAARVRKGGRGDPADLARTLVEDANRNGGIDNVSVIAIRVGTLPQAAEARVWQTGREVEAYLAEDARIAAERERGEADGERGTSEGFTPPSDPLDGMEPDLDSDEADTDDLPVVAGRSRRALPVGLLVGFAVVAVVATVVLLLLRHSAKEAEPDWEPFAPTGSEGATPPTLPTLTPEERVARSPQRLA